MQQNHIKGAPAYLTEAWDETKKSVQNVKTLDPKFAIPSHATHEGRRVDQTLELLSQNFSQIAVLDQGHFVDKQDKIMIMLLH